MITPSISVQNKTTYPCICCNSQSLCNILQALKLDTCVKIKQLYTSLLSNQNLQITWSSFKIIQLLYLQTILHNQKISIEHHFIVIITLHEKNEKQNSSYEFLVLVTFETFFDMQASSLSHTHTNAHAPGAGGTIQTFSGLSFFFFFLIRLTFLPGIIKCFRYY